jgi:hypothetical protein
VRIPEDLLFSSGVPRNAWRALGYAVVGVGLGFLLVPDLVKPFPRFANDAHMRTSYNHAVSSAFCDTLKTSSAFDLPAVMTEQPDELYRPVRDVIERRFGSMATYCASLTIPRVDNETSLMWLMRAVLWMNPGTSTAGIGARLAAIRLAIVVVLCFALSRAGASVFLTVSVAVATCAVLRALAPYQYNNNPFILSLPLLLVGLYALCIVDLDPRRVGRVAVAFAGLGGLTAFCVNMRTSHTPIYIAMFVVFVIAWVRSPSPASPRVAPITAGIAVASYVTAVAAGHALLVRPMERLGGEGIVHHTIAHPLVLALATPENDLSRREGLKWDDLNGLEVARRIDPAATYLSYGYERALTRYYLNLWRTHPRDMIEVYRLKFAEAGGGVVQEAVHLLEHAGLPVRVGRRLAAVDVSGFVLFGATIATGVLGWMLHRRRGSAVGFAWVLISVGAAGTILEAALIMPRFYIFYHSVLLWYVLVTPVAGLQLALDSLHSRSRADAGAA